MSTRVLIVSLGLPVLELFTSIFSSFPVFFPFSLFYMLALSKQYIYIRIRYYASPECTGGYNIHINHYHKHATVAHHIKTNNKLLQSFTLHCRHLRRKKSTKKTTAARCTSSWTPVSDRAVVGNVGWAVALL